MRATSERSIRIIGEPREGGYIYFESNDLPGFSLMLNAEQASTEQTVTEHLIPAATAYMQALLHYESDRIKERSPLSTVKKYSNNNESRYIAELCPA